MRLRLAVDQENFRSGRIAPFADRDAHAVRRRDLLEDRRRVFRHERFPSALFLSVGRSVTPRRAHWKEVAPGGAAASRATHDKVGRAWAAAAQPPSHKQLMMRDQ